MSIVTVGKKSQVHISVASGNQAQATEKSTELKSSYTKSELARIPKYFNAVNNGKRTSGHVAGEYGLESSSVLISPREVDADGFENNKSFKKARFNAVGIYQMQPGGGVTLVDSLKNSELKKLVGGAVLDVGQSRADRIRSAANDGQDALVLLSSLSIGGKTFLVKSSFNWDSDI